MQVSYFEENASFVQKIAVTSESSFTLTAEVTFMACNDEMCLPPDTRELTIEVKGSSNAGQTVKAEPRTTANGINRTGWAIFFAGFIGGLLALLTP